MSPQLRTQGGGGRASYIVPSEWTRFSWGECETAVVISRPPGILVFFSNDSFAPRQLNVLLFYLLLFHMRRSNSQEFECV